MSTPDLERDYHGFNESIWAPGVYWLANEDNPPPLNSQGIYLLTSSCYSGDCGHDVVLCDNNCNSDCIAYYRGHYDGVYVYEKLHPGSFLKCDKSAVDVETNYHCYSQNYEFYLTGEESSFWYGMRSTDISDNQINIHKYLSYNEYDFFRSWTNYFSLSDYVASLQLFAKYYISTPAPNFPAGCIQYYDISFYVLIPTCVSLDYWQFLLTYPGSDGTMQYLSSSQYNYVTWELRGHLSAATAGVPVSSTLLLSGTRKPYFAKSALIQDTVIYTIGGVDYQGFDYWYIVAKYQDSFYSFRIYGVDPPCSGGYSEGQSVVGIGVSVQGRGQGRIFTGGGGIEEIKR